MPPKKPSARIAPGRKAPRVQLASKSTGGMAPRKLSQIMKPPVDDRELLDQMRDLQDATRLTINALTLKNAEMEAGAKTVQAERPLDE
ncbi:hypothetical protein PENSPDRAFT_682262 [Peniophora sp. CONT]|nr:hypothetical protein PENSPDRAFT_682262 [Peniophora sp. CONT]